MKMELGNQTCDMTKLSENFGYSSIVTLISLCILNVCLFVVLKLHYNY